MSTPSLSPGSTTPSNATITQEELHLRQLLQDLHINTGDVVLFDRQCSSMGLYGSALCICAKFFGQTQWDHNGVIIRAQPSPSSSSTSSSIDTRGIDDLFLLEATLTGVKLRPLVTRLLRSRSHEIAIRPLQVPRTIKLEQEALTFAFESLHAPYEDNPAKFFNASVSVPKKSVRERMFGAYIATKKELIRLDTELEHRDKMPLFERKALLQEREAVNGRYQALGTKLKSTERSVFENAVVEAEVRVTKMFCSQLVAKMYQDMGLLLPYPSANSYLPKHFSARDGGDFLQLQQGASFLPEISLRKTLETQVERFATRAKEVKERGPRTATEIAAIVHCLRRHQLFHTLNESELLATASQFRRRVLTNGEVVFYQGDAGDYFYIIERGDCDVFVDYNFAKTQKALQTADSNSAPNPEHQRKIALHKRKTLALPEFKSSSSLVGKNERVHVATKGPGNAFGESALMYDTPRRATIQASTFNSDDEEEAVVVWQLDKNTFCEILARHPGTQQSLEERRFLLEALEDHPLFAELDDHAKALAVRKCFPLNVRVGTTILRQGEPGDYFYLVESGRCEVSRRKPKAAKPFVDRVIGRGATFGEAALLYNSRRGASVKALDDAKIWCMDRASFVTITRSGSSALHSIFRKVGTTVVSGLNESFATERDLRRMLTDAQKTQLVKQSTNEDDDENEEYGKTMAHSTPLPSVDAYNRAVQLALALLLNDPSGLVNFSQFAHFHIALGASNIDQLLPEAAFRVLKSVTDSYDGVSSRPSIPSTTSPSVFNQDDPDQSAIKLNDLPRALHQWMCGSKTAEAVSNELETPVQMTPGRLAFYESLFELPAHQFGDQYVTHDDLVRGITAFEAEDARSESEQSDDRPQSDDVTAAKEEFRAFLAALKSDISALRTIWRAAELQADGGNRPSDFNDQQAFSFNARLKLGWLSALRQNPTGNDWEHLQPEMEDNTQETAHNEINAIIPRQQLTAQVTWFAAAIAAGALVRTVCAPLERLKMLMQVPTPKPTAASTVTATAKLLCSPAPYTSLTRGLLNVAKLSGLRSLFSGNLTHCIWVVPSVPAKFVLWHIYQEQLEHLFPDSSAAIDAIGVGGPRYSASMTNLAAGGFAGLTLHCLLYPLDVIRGRLAVQQYYNANRPSSGIIDCARKIRDKEGLRGFYRGFMPASLGVVTYIGCNIAFYESLRPVFVLYDREDTNNQLEVPGQILCATTASLVSQCISYPFDVIRRRVQLQGAKWHPELTFASYKSTWHCLKLSIEAEGGGIRGLRSLYRGLFVNAVKLLPSTMISFVSYEKLRGMKHNVDDT
ncbi:unnamed protein product [Peronospora belbahrii]|uniref:Cyclic nucleotide-binding domain-containing protein n=1 Tax=Peronospora belbahrii TaxID=622444 RepID=A0AAU9L6L5_9STRA|nr:unnamed protein product [Peronospora belbahrii]